MTSPTDEPHVSSLDEKPVTGYQGVSVAAVLALVLGVVSALALVHPLLWVVPAATVVVAIVALRAVGAEDANLTGRGLAITGLALALLFGLWAPTRILTRQWHLYRQAHAFADEWLELVRTGQLQQAHQLTLPHVERQKPGVSLEKLYSDSAEARRMFDNFYDTKPLKTLVEFGDRVTYEYTGGVGISPREFITEHVTVAYTARYTEDGRERELPIRVVLDRDEGDAGHFYWRVRAVNDPNRMDPL